MVMVVGLLLGIVWVCAERGDSSGWHPDDGTLWQSHYWVVDFPTGPLGLEEWRSEGQNVETNVSLGFFDFWINKPATVVAAVGLSITVGIGFLCVAGWRSLITR